MATSNLNNTRLLFTTDGTTISTQMTASAPDTLTLVGDAAADVLIQGVSTPINDNDAVNKGYVDGTKEGVTWKDRVIAATTVNIDIGTDLENGDTLDGVTLSTGDRVLVKNQGTATENGIYIVVAAGAASRSEDLDTGADASGVVMVVNQGTLQANTAWICTSLAGSAVVDTDNLTFEQFSDEQENIIQPIINSAASAPNATVGNDIVYTATSDTDFTSFIVEDDDGTGITFIGNGPVLQGGSGAGVGTYTLVLRTGNVFGVGPRFNLSWEVTP